MLIRSIDPHHPQAGEITPRAAYDSRRALLRRMAAGAAGTALASWAARQALADTALYPAPGRLPALAGQRSAVSGALTMEKITAYQDASSYNNFYEFGTDKSDPARNSATLKPRPWTVQVDGLVHKPRRFDLDELLQLAPLEERIYRLRCVEGWSMVIPWVGFSLAALLQQVQPLGSAKYVEFTTLADKAVMPGIGSRVLDWPYVEGLRLDEALHPLTLLAFGMYGELLPTQNGAPVRLVLPWKYGFKSAKSLVRIRLVEQQPGTAAEVPGLPGGAGRPGARDSHRPPRFARARDLRRVAPREQRAPRHPSRPRRARGGVRRTGTRVGLSPAGRRAAGPGPGSSPPLAR